MARAALEALSGGEPIAFVRHVAGAEGPETSGGLIVRSGSTNGTLGSTDLDRAGTALGQRALASGGVETQPLSGGGLLFAQGYRPMDRLVIAGGGHIAVELGALGDALGFRVLIMDDRPEFVDPDRFAPGVETRLVDFAEAFDGIEMSASTYLVLVTRGHEHDLDCLRRVLAERARPAYVGLIGSRRRVRAAFLALRNAGVADAEIARLHAPIGLGIGAETPAEIAVAIAAELVAVRRGVPPPGSLRDRERVLERLQAASQGEAAGSPATPGPSRDDDEAHPRDSAG
jgi:xanthine dehydrogenase accessory factor